MNLADYVKKRNGVPIGHNRSLRNNLERSLGAKDFSAFWNFWNPIFGYYLGMKIFRPLKKLLPIGISVLFTFVFCGLIHDLVTTIVRGEISLFFAVWFLLMGLAVIVAKQLRYNLSHKKWILRASVNLAIIMFCLLMTMGLNKILNFY